MEPGKMANIIHFTVHLHNGHFSNSLYFKVSLEVSGEQVEGHPDQAHHIAANPRKLPLFFFISYRSAFTSQILKYCLKPIRFFDSEKEGGTLNSISLEKWITAPHLWHVWSILSDGSPTLCPLPTVLLSPYVLKSHYGLPASNSLLSNLWSRWPPLFFFQHANGNRWPPAWEVLMVLYCLHQEAKPWSPTCQVLHAESNLRLKLNLLPSPCRDPLMDPYLASQALCTVLPMPDTAPCASNLPDQGNKTVYSTNAIIAGSPLPCPSRTFTSSLAFLYNLVSTVRNSAHCFLVGWLWHWLSHWTATASSVAAIFKYLVPAQLHYLEHIVDYLISSSKQSSGQAFW